MIVGASLVGARNADNACQCEHCYAMQGIVLHGGHCPSLFYIVPHRRNAIHCPHAH